jgi:hypothetical protein
MAIVGRSPAIRHRISDVLFVLSSANGVWPRACNAECQHNIK